MTMKSDDNPTPEQQAKAEAMNALFNQVQDAISILLNGSKDSKTPWTFVLAALNTEEEAFAYVSSNDDPKHAAGMFMIASERMYHEVKRREAEEPKPTEPTKH
jgi:hypothetical protein